MTSTSPPAHVTRAADTVDIAWLGGTVHHILLDGDATADRLTAVRTTMGAGAASPVHVHDLDDETVLVLSGTGTFWAGSERWVLSSGDTAFLPRGVPHTYAFTGPAELLTVGQPAGLEHLFLEAGWDLREPVPPDWAVDLGVLATAGAARGQRVLGPPLAPQDTMPGAYLLST